MTGTNIFDPKIGKFIPKKGPVFGNIILADEIKSLALLKCKVPLLEAMQEKQVTIGENTFPLDYPFLVLATQNPIEQEGTYPLPEAQLDRFLMKSIISYPTKEEEKEILNRSDKLLKNEKAVSKVLNKKKLLTVCKKLVSLVYVDEKIKDYVLDLVWASRKPKEYGLEKLEPLIEIGASPRASMYLILCAKAHAFLQGVGFVTPENIKAVAAPILRHRIKISFEAEAEEKTSDDLIKMILNQITVP